MASFKALPYVYPSTKSGRYLGVAMLNSYEKLIRGAPTVPRLVFTSITPLPPRIPYKAVATASFNTLTDSISSGLNSSMLRSNPSTRMSGVLLLVEPNPRTNMVAPSAHATLAFCKTLNPGILPNNRLEDLMLFLCERLSSPATEMAPVTSFVW